MAQARPRPLTARQRRFVREYMIDDNGTQAAIRAGYSKRSAGHIAYDMLHHSPGVKAAAAAAIAARSERLRVTADRVVTELARIAFADWRDYAVWGEDGLQLKPSADLSEDAAAAIAEFHPADDKRPARVKLHAKRAALDLLARHVGITGRGRVAPGWNPHEQEGAGEDARQVLRRMLDRVEQEPDEDAAAADAAE
jgi:phage terminase small subunit